MASTRSIMSYNCSSTIFFKDFQRFQPFSLNPNRYLSSSNDQGPNYDFLQLISFKKMACKNHARMNFVVHNNVQPSDEAPIPSEKSSNSWKGWILGVLLSILLPFQRQKLNPFIALRNKVEMVVESAEFVVDVVENVAEKVVEITKDLGDKLPAGKLKGAINIAGNIAREIDKDAHLVGDLIHKVEKVEKEVESFIEPVFYQVEGTPKQSNDPKLD